MSLAAPSHVCIIGGGVVGAASAYYLRRRGFEVTVLEAGTVGNKATKLAAGAYRSQFDWPEETSLTMRSRVLWQEIEARHGISMGFRNVGFLILASTNASAATIDARRSFQEELGLNIRDLDTAEITALAPGLVTDDLLQARFTSGDGYGRPQQVTQTVMALAVKAGVTLRENTTVTEVREHSGSVSGVTTSTGEQINCDIVLNAAGLAATEIGDLVDLHLPVMGRRQHQFFTETSGGLDSFRTPNIMEVARRLYLRGEGEGYLLSTSATDEDHRTDTEVTWSLTESLGATLEHRWPRLAPLPITDGWVGCYPISPDDRAMFGEHPTLSKFYYSAGLGGHGFMNGLATGEAMARLIETGLWGDIHLGALSAARFSRG